MTKLAVGIALTILGIAGIVFLNPSWALICVVIASIGVFYAMTSVLNKGKKC